MMSTDYKYTIYIYSDKSYGSTGLNFENKEKAIEKCVELKRLNDAKYGIFIEYREEDLYHRRLVWKDGENIEKEYKKKISSTAESLLAFIKAYYSSYKRYPKFEDMKNELQKKDFDIVRLMKVLLDANLVNFSPPFHKNCTYKVTKS